MLSWQSTAATAPQPSVSVGSICRILSRVMSGSLSSWSHVVWTTLEMFSPEQMMPAFTVPASMRCDSMIRPSLKPMQALVMSSASDSSGMPRAWCTRQAVAGSKKSRDTEQLIRAPI